MGIRNTVVYTVDGNADALKWLEVSLRSLRRHLGDEVRVVICTDSPRDFGYGAECVDVRPVVAKYGLDRISQMQWYDKPVPPMQIFRLALPVVPELSDTDRVVFVDADTEFLDSRWGEVFGIECDYVAGVRDGGKTSAFIDRRYQVFAANEAVRKMIGGERLDAIRRGSYVNGGVLVMNLAAMRSRCDYGNEMLPAMIDLCVRAHLQYLDQDIINLYFDPLLISSRFNSSAHLHQPGEPTYLEHYTGKDKWTSAVYPPVVHQLARHQDAVDIVYTVGRPSEHDDMELRWSLRSVAKYGKGVGRIIVTSPYEREWLSDEVIQVDSQDFVAAGYKHHNILKAILDTVEAVDLSGEFSVSSDDHFYVRPTDFSRQPMVAQHWAIPQRYGSSNHLQTMLWSQSCVDTRDFLEARGMPTIDFQMHRNSRWHGGLVRENLSLFKDAFKLRFCVEPHVLMQNLWVHTQPNVKVEFRKDCKLREFHGVERGCDCISCYDQAFLDKPFMDFMEREFGEKCRWER